MKQSFIFLSVLLLFIVSVNSCSNEDVLSSNELLETRSRDGGVIRDLALISYNIDLVTITEPIGTPSDLDRALMTPITEKQRVRMVVRSNGEIRLETQKLETKNPIVINHLTLPNDRPEIAKTVLANNTMQLFDLHGNLLRTVAGQSISMPYLSDKIKETLSKMDSVNINQILACLRANVNLDSLNKMIKNPPKGVTITKFTKDIVSVSMPVPAELKSSEAETAVQIVDISNKLLLGSRLYGKGNKTLQCMMFRYNDCILKGFKQETQQMLPSGIMVNVKTMADIENLNLSIL